MGIFISNFLPTEVGGDVFRAFEVGKISKKKAESFASVYMERLTGLFALITYAFLGSWYSWDTVGDLKITFIILGCSASIILLSSFIMTDFGRRIISDGTNCLKFKRINEIIINLYDAILLYKKKKNSLLVALVVSFPFQLLLIWLVFAIGQTMGLALSFMQSMVLLPFVTIVSLLPVSINAIGIREGAFVYLLSIFSIPIEESFLLALLYRLGVTIPGIIGGVVFLVNILRPKQSAQ